VIIFYSVRFLSKKCNQTEFFLKKNRNRFKPTGFSSVQFLGQKKRFGSVFSFFFGFGSVRFDFFSFRLIKPKLNRTGWFIQNFNRFNRFFFTVQFFRLFFSGLIGFSVFLSSLMKTTVWCFSKYNFNQKLKNYIKLSQRKNK